MTRSPDILFLTEYIKNVLYFATVRQGKVLKSTNEIHYFCIDNELTYENYYSDFGPLNLGRIYTYCKILHEKVKQYLNKQSIVHYTSIDPKKKANAAFLIGCYGVLYLSLSPRDALRPLVLHGQTYRPFQDATQGEPIYTISLIDCLQAIKKAREFRLFNFQDFNYDEYERLDNVHGGDLNWIVPGKFLAFIGPVDYSVSLYHPPEMYIQYFRANNVKIVIRLNKRMYDANVFANAGILHYDLFFPDGSYPPRHILSKFLQISEETDGAIAVHCKAGLGRTGSLIGCYLIKHYRMTAHEAIGWMRICRPGSVIGHQQEWLEHLEAWLTKQGNLYRKRTFQDIEKFPIHEFGIYSVMENAMKHMPVVINKPQSPPPPILRQTRLDTKPPVRPQASRIREDQSTRQSEQPEMDDEEMKEKFISSCDLTISSKIPPTLLKGCVLKNQVFMEEYNIHPARRRKKQSFWRKYFCCRPCTKSCTNGLWMLAVRCVSVTPQRWHTSRCCSLLDMVAPSKTAEETSDWRTKLSSNQKNIKGEPSAKQTTINPTASRRTSGAGEPRPPTRSSSRSNGPKLLQQRNRDIPVEIIAKNIPPLPTFRTTQGPVIKSLNDARNFLLRSSAYNEQRDKQLNSSIIVTPQPHAYRATNYMIERAVQGNNVASIQPSPFNTAYRGSTQPQQRRRLGRSPSPSPTRYVDQNRATNTPTTHKFLAKNSSKCALKEALSRLRLTMPRDGSGSIGAASLGARRDAPAVKRAPSVRSDERPLATQGDMLNSIKFQRRFRDTLNADKLSAMYNEKMSLHLKDKPNTRDSSSKPASTAARLGFCTDFNAINLPAKSKPSRDVNSKTSTGYRLGFSQDQSNLDRTSHVPKPFASTVRPTSPKGRQRSFSPNLF